MSKSKSWRCPTRDKSLLTGHPRPKLDTIFNIKAVRCKCFKGLHLVILSLSGIRTFCLINESYWNITEEHSMPFTFKILNVLACTFSSLETFTFRLVIIPSAPKVFSSLTSLLFFTFVTSKQVRKTFAFVLICFSSDTTSKSISFSDVFTDFTTFTPISKWAHCSFSRI